MTMRMRTSTAVRENTITITATRMVEDGEDCADVLIQLSAVKSEINNTGKLILKQHMEHCIVEAVRENDQTSIDKMNEAIDRFMK